MQKKFSKGICNFLTSSQDGNLCGLIVAFHVGLNSVSERFLVPYLKYLAKCNASWDRLLISVQSQRGGGAGCCFGVWGCSVLRAPLSLWLLSTSSLWWNTRRYCRPQNQKKIQLKHHRQKKSTEKMLKIIVRSNVKKKRLLPLRLKPIGRAYCLFFHL